MTPTQRQAMEMALEAIRKAVPTNDLQSIQQLNAILALRAALAEQADDKADAELSAWTPTSEKINALPEPVREYIHNLETHADPAGTVRDLTIAKDTIRALEASNRMLRDDKADAERYRWLVGGRTLEQCNDAARSKT